MCIYNACICVYMHIYIYIHICIHSHVYIYIYIYTHTYIHIDIYVYNYVYVYMCVVTIYTWSNRERERERYASDHFQKLTTGEKGSLHSRKASAQRWRPGSRGQAPPAVQSPARIRHFSKARL